MVLILEILLVLLALAGLPGAVAAQKRTQPDMLPKQKTRARILELVKKRPGVTLSEICRREGIGWGTAQHHLYLMKRSSLLRSVSQKNRHRFFQGDTNPDERQAIAAILNGRSRGVLAAVLASPGIQQAALTKEVAISRKVLGTTIRGLVDAGLVSVVKEGRSCHYQPTVEADHFMELALQGRAP